MEENHKESLKDKVEGFINKRAKVILLVILIAAFLIRLKYLTINAAVWWDEADYLSLAKHFGLGLPDQSAPWRARPIPFLWSPIYYLGGTEIVIRFINLLVSVAGVYLAYILGKEFFDTKVALFSALFMAVYHEGIFWTARIGLDTYAVIMWVFITIWFYRGYIQNKGKKYLYATGAMYGFGVYAYDSIGFFAVAAFLYIIVTEKLSFLKNKKFWCIVIGAIIAFTPLAIYSKVTFDAVYPRITNMIGAQVVADEGTREFDRPLSQNLNEYFSFFAAFPYYLKGPIFIFFILGLLLFYEVIIGFDIMMKNKEGSENLKKDYYVLLGAFVLPFMFGFVVMVSNFYYEARYLLPAMPIYLAIAGKGLFKVQDYIAKHSYLLSWALVLVVIGMSVNSQLAFADQIIKAKKDTYLQEKLGGEWLKQMTNPGDILVGCGQSIQILYYSERVLIRNEDVALLEKSIRENKPKFYVLDFWDSSCANVRYPFENQDKMQLVNAYFYDEAKQQPIYLIFAINQSAYA